MTSQGDGPAGQPPTQNSLPALDVRKTRSTSTDDALEVPGSRLPFRAASPSSFIQRSSTLSSISKFGRSSTSSPPSYVAENSDETRTLIVRSFSPVVGVFASPETDDLVRGKGFKDGLVGLIQPFGERITGKIVVRDSVGASRSWEDFGVRFLDLKSIVQEQPIKGDGILEALEDLVEQYLEQHTGGRAGYNLQEMSPYHRLFLSRLLSSQSLSPHETLSHPVATVIAISSSTPAPIETLRNLYAQTAQGEVASPPYANPEYLRYYLLVHDDDKDDFAKSSSLFDQMKRHFGLNCHLLRLRSAPCSVDDEDGEPIPDQEWLSASADISKLQETTQLIDLDANTVPQIYTTDASAIRLFARELVSQSIVPYMEQRISMWNEQIASKRRGISARFMSISRRWGGIGGLGSSRTSSANNVSNTGSSSGNYDTIQNFYRWDAPEALLRKLADFAMMLRDYKLAASTYELLRSDYNNDKAWKYLAGVNEMCCVANLLNPLLSNSTNSSTSSSKTLPKLETFDTMLETATYSYLTRCDEPALALRSILLSVELLKVRGRLPSELASKWAIRALDLGLAPQTTNIHVLISERIASCYAGNSSNPSLSQSPPPNLSNLPAALIPPHRTRHAALWSLTSAEEWMKLGRAPFAASCLDDAHDLYATLRNHDSSMRGFQELSTFMRELDFAVRMKMGSTRKRGVSGVSATGRLVEPDGLGMGMGTGMGGGNGDGDGDPLGAGRMEEDMQIEQLQKRDGRARGGHGHGRSLTVVSAVVDLQGLGGGGAAVGGRGDDFE